MKINIENGKQTSIELTVFDVETAVIQYISACNPECFNEYGVDVVDSKACTALIYKLTAECK